MPPDGGHHLSVETAHQIPVVLSWFTVVFICQLAMAFCFHCVSLGSANSVAVACLVDDQSGDPVRVMFCIPITSVCAQAYS